ncbi:MAG TPA: DUF3108 domain-containing protein [Gammaproteobacteria bacterium]
MRPNASISLSVAALVAGAMHTAALAQEPAANSDIATYAATYAAEYKGRDAGLAEFSVSYDALQDVYTFRSYLKVKGLLKIVAPNPAIEHSTFVVRDGKIQPLAFRYEDGTRKGGNNFQARFDWDTRNVILDGEQHVELEIAPGTLDRGSLQVALMHDMAGHGALGPYVIADDDSLKTYELTRVGEERMETPLGELDVLRYRQQRVGSSSITSIWVAPSLQYLPVRMERQRGNETDTIFVLESVEGLGAAR